MTYLIYLKLTTSCEMSWGQGGFLFVWPCCGDTPSFFWRLTPGLPNANHVLHPSVLSPNKILHLFHANNQWFSNIYHTAHAYPLVHGPRIPHLSFLFCSAGFPLHTCTLNSYILPTTAGTSSLMKTLPPWHICFLPPQEYFGS